MHSLHVAVSALRHYLDSSTGSYLLFEVSGYLINPDLSVEDDCTDFLRLSNAAEQFWYKRDFERAQQGYLASLVYYLGDYYVDTRDQTWAVLQRERLLARYLSVLNHLGQTFIAVGRVEDAVECFQRLLARDEYREDACRQVIRCYWRLGRRSEALRQYTQFCAILADELGLAPMEETQALYHLIMGDGG